MISRKQTPRQEILSRAVEQVARQNFERWQQQLEPLGNAAVYDVIESIAGAKPDLMRYYTRLLYVSVDLLMLAVQRGAGQRLEKMKTDYQLYGGKHGTSHQR